MRTLDSYATYYAKWSKVWEAQALLRADAVVGDEDLRRRFTELIDPLRYPDGGHQRRTTWSRSAGSRRGSTTSGCRAAPTRTPTSSWAAADWPTSSGRSSCSSSGTPASTRRCARRAPSTRSPPPAEAGLLDEQDADWLAHGWRTVSRVRNAVTLVRGKPGDHLPRDAREKAAVASVMGYPPGASDELVNDYLRHTRRTRAVVDRVFWG